MKGKAPPPPPNRQPNSADFAHFVLPICWVSEFRPFVLLICGVSVNSPIRFADTLRLLRAPTAECSRWTSEGLLPKRESCTVEVQKLYCFWKC